MVFRQRYRYRFGDIDDAGIAYYPKLLHAFHCAMEDWWADGLGTPYAEVMKVERYGLPAAHLEAGFHEPIRYGDEPWIHLGVLRIGKSSVELGFWMTRTDGGDAACWMRARTVGVDMDSLRPVPVPERWRAAFARFALREEDFPGHRHGLPRPPGR